MTAIHTPFRIPFHTALHRVGRQGLATALLALATGLTPAAARENLPQRNLLVEWRVGGQGYSQQRQGGIEVGRVIIDSRRGVIAQGGLLAGTVRTETTGGSTQQVTVLNGGRARLFVGRTQSLTAWRLAAGPTTFGGFGPADAYDGPDRADGRDVRDGRNFRQPQVAVVPQTVWIDVGQGIHVTPRWSGGRDVVVDIEAQTRQPLQPGTPYGALDPDGQTRRTELASTVSVPLGEWVVVASSGGRSQRAQSGTLSTRDVDEGQSEQLEIRVTAP